MEELDVSSSAAHLTVADDLLYNQTAVLPWEPWVARLAAS